MLTTAASCQFYEVRPDEFEFVHEMAGRLMRYEVCTADTFRAVQAIQRGSSMCLREDGIITGVFGILLLRQSAVATLLSGAFDGVDIDLDLLSRPEETPAIGYAWGVAATTRIAGAAITQFGQLLCAGPLNRIPFITKAVTEAGRRVAISRMGYRPLRGPDDDLLINGALPLVAA